MSNFFSSLIGAYVSAFAAIVFIVLTYLLYKKTTNYIQDNMRSSKTVLVLAKIILGIVFILAFAVLIATIETITGISIL